MPHEQAEMNMRLFAERVMPVLHRDQTFAEVDSSRPLATAPEKAHEDVFAPA